MSQKHQEIDATKLSIEGNDIFNQLAGSIVTGVRTGGEVTINVDPTKYNIAAGTGFIKNWTNPALPTTKEVSWNEMLAISPPDASLLFTVNGIDESGNLVHGGVLIDESGVQFTDQQKKIIINLQTILTLDGVNVTNIGGSSTPSYEVIEACVAWIQSNPLVTTGNEYSAASSTTITKSAGTSKGLFVNRDVDTQSNIEKENDAIPTVSAIGSYRDGGSGFVSEVPATLIVTNKIDKGTGTLVTMTDNKFAVRRLYFSSEIESTSMPYGQKEYNTLAEAKASVISEKPTINPLISGAGVFIAALVHKKNADLNNVLEAEFVPIVRESIGSTGIEAEHNELYKLAIGSMVETQSITITESAGTVSLNLEQAGGGDLTLLFSDGLTSFDSTPTATIALTTGSDTSPQINYVYIDHSTPTVMSVSTSSFPATEHVPIAKAIVQSASGVSSDGVYELQSWTDHVSLEGDNGHISHLNAWIRSHHATWIDGALLTPTVTSNGGSLDNLNIATASGNIRQLHAHSFPSLDTGVTDNVFVINEFTVPYSKYGDLNLIIQDAVGTTLRGNNDRYNLVIWGSVSENDSDSKLYVNLPTGKYTGGAASQDTVAIDDTDQTSDFTIPSDFTGTGFLIARLTVKYTTTASGTLEILNTEDLRGQIPAKIAGGVGTQNTDFPDNVFRISDDSDVTKKIAFDASGIATSNVRTITMPDADVDLGSIGIDTFEISLFANSSVFTNTFLQRESGYSGNTWYEIGEDLQLVGIKQALHSFSTNDSVSDWEVTVREFDLNGTLTASVGVSTGSVVTTATQTVTVDSGGALRTAFGTTTQSKNIQVDGSSTPKGVFVYCSSQNLTSIVGAYVTLIFKRN